MVSHTKMGRRRAHPRVGGDGRRGCRRERPAAGLTPAWAGTARVEFQDGPGWGGLTPAWAGTASAPADHPRSRWAHPRVGGDGAARQLAPPGPLGSPPRGRGRRSHFLIKRDKHGLTPAWAGTAGLLNGPPSERWAHPRVGGDGWMLSTSCYSLRGSPPRGRERPTTSSAEFQMYGLTPAWAGTAHTWPDALRRGRAPPAWAGTAPSTPTRPAHQRAHPRVGGDGALPPVRSVMN